ncbi:unnamed protein product [Sphagnum jensenii]|uniref:Glycosyltransferase RgtA/B/C/D-like domain-containing protein n=1 Tax=Sphagnum jensenii TaxID=128206 RepID=A0ABP0V605_9BRYO
MLRYQQRESIKMESILREFPDVDELDFHFMAVNFALTNEFPVIGYLRDTSAYMISYKHGLSAGVDSLYLNMFKIAGPVHTFARPPLCSLMVGMVYKIFGVHLYVLIWFNILLVAAMAGMLPYMGYRIWNIAGFFSGIIASVLFLSTLDFSYVSMDLEILAAFLFLMIFYVITRIDRKYTMNLMLLLGILISLEFLNKPVILFIPALFLLYYYFSTGKPKLMFYLKQISPGLIGIALVMLPWTLYINHAKSISVKERTDWSIKTLASMEAPLTYSSPQEVGASVANIEHAMRNFVKFIYVCHTQQEGGKACGDHGLVNDWAALKRWDFDFFADNFGEIEASIGKFKNGLGSYHGAQEDRPVSECIASIQSGNLTEGCVIISPITVFPASIQNDYSAPVYCRDGKFLRSNISIGPAGFVTPLHQDMRKICM